LKAPRKTLFRKKNEEKRKKNESWYMERKGGLWKTEFSRRSDSFHEHVTPSAHQFVIWKSPRGRDMGYTRGFKKAQKWPPDVYFSIKLAAERGGTVKRQTSVRLES
jgi:hypothetical protein